MNDSDSSPNAVLHMKLTESRKNASFKKPIPEKTSWSRRAYAEHKSLPCNEKRELKENRYRSLPRKYGRIAVFAQRVKTVRRRCLQLGRDAELLEEIDNGLTDALHNELDVVIGDVVCRGDDDVVAANAVNRSGTWVHIYIVSILQPCRNG